MEKYGQMSRYGAIAQALPPVTGKTFFLVNASEAAFNALSQKFRNDDDGVVRVYTTWAAVISAVEADSAADLIVVSPQFTTAPTLAQIDSLNNASVTVVQAGQNLPDGSYLATKSTFSLATLTTITLFKVNGRIDLLDVLGEVVTTLGAATSGVAFQVIPTVGSTTALCATTDVKNLAIGAQMTITGTPANALIATTQGAITKQAAAMRVKAGYVYFTTTQTTTGNVRARVHYKPIDPGAFVSPV